MAGNVAPNIVTDGLVLCLDAANPKSFVSGSTTWRDISRNTLTSTLSNGPAYTSNFSGIITFDGSDDQLLATTFPNETVNSFTVITRPKNTVNAAAAGSSVVGFRKNAVAEGNADSNWYFAFGSITVNLTNEYITLADLASPQSKRTGITDGGSLTANTWYIITCNWNGSYYDIYVNNTQQTVVASATGHCPQLTNPNCLFMGYRTGDGGVDNRFYNGDYSMLLVYNKSLTATEMTTNYNTLKTRFGL